MKLSTPVFRLKRQAKLLSRKEKIPLHAALDRIAKAEGFAAWSLLARRAAQPSPSRALLSGLEPGDLLLLGARPGQGKTTLGLELLRDAAAEGRRAIFFTLFLTAEEATQQLRSLGPVPTGLGDWLSVVTSDEIGGAFVIRHMAQAAPGTVAVIDYLQMLDRQPHAPGLPAQLRALRDFARARGVILAVLSQIDRSYDPAARPLPDLRDIHPQGDLYPAVFTKTCFLHGGEMLFQPTA